MTQHPKAEPDHFPLCNALIHAMSQYTSLTKCNTCDTELQNNEPIPCRNFQMYLHLHHIRIRWPLQAPKRTSQKNENHPKQPIPIIPHAPNKQYHALQHDLQTYNTGTITTPPWSQTTLTLNQIKQILNPCQSHDIPNNIIPVMVEVIQQNNPTKHSRHITPDQWKTHTSIPKHMIHNPQASHISLQTGNKMTKITIRSTMLPPTFPSTQIELTPQRTDRCTTTRGQHKIHLQQDTPPMLAQLGPFFSLKKFTIIVPENFCIFFLIWYIGSSRSIVFFVPYHHTTYT